MTSDSTVKKQFKQLKPWGIYTSVDIYGCDPKTIRSARKIKQFARELCELIQMKRFRDTTVVDFGDDPRISGFSMTQLIETSLVSGHFANQSNAAYIDIFSCKYFPPFKAAKFTKKFFSAQSMTVQVNFRR